MKKILIVIYDMRIGGAQKSLLSFLQTLAADGRVKQYEVHVLPFHCTGEFLSRIPKEIHVDEPSNVLRWLGTRMNRALFTKHFSMRGLLGKMLWIFSSRLHRKPQNINKVQTIWHCWKRLIPFCQEHYDVAIAYIDGLPAYYVVDKVQAEKKVLWLHSDYQKQAYDPVFDNPYYRASNAIITVSDECLAKINSAFPQYASKMHVLENITSWTAVQAQAQAGRCLEYDGTDGLKLLSVGRLHEQKGMDIAVDAARHLKEAGVHFRWLVVGEGSERKRLEEMITEYDLEDCFRLIGARENPYIYMRECDILVQPSRIEGKSIVLDEAKMLCKPVVSTCYPTVVDAIKHGQTGWIVEMNGKAICNGLLHLHQHPEICTRIKENLKALPKGNEEALRNYLDIMF